LAEDTTDSQLAKKLRGMAAEYQAKADELARERPKDR
jgi:hypothetical protein